MPGVGDWLTNGDHENCLLQNVALKIKREMRLNEKCAQNDADRCSSFIQALSEPGCYVTPHNTASEEFRPVGHFLLSSHIFLSHICINHFEDTCIYSLIST